METRTVHTIDLPDGGFLVIDQIIQVKVTDGSGTFLIGVLLTNGTTLVVAEFPWNPWRPMAPRIDVGFDATAEKAQARDAADTWAAELRYCIEHP